MINLIGNKLWRMLGGPPEHRGESEEPELAGGESTGCNSKPLHLLTQRNKSISLVNIAISEIIEYITIVQHQKITISDMIKCC